MAASLSAYWVKFFQGAGFPLDVATKHAVVFSNNRIKPDMLPDLDKASLKDMGITLIGDMIAILRYAKKVVEAMTCENFLVDTEDEKPIKKVKAPVASRETVKNIVPKATNKSVSAGKVKSSQEVTTKAATRPAAVNSIARASTVKKKVAPSPRVVSAVSKEVAKAAVVKRKIVPQVSESESDEIADLDLEREEWMRKNGKKVKLSNADEEKVGYTVIMPKGRTVRSQQILKKMTDQKRTVFDRLGDSSVTSTTNPAESNPAPTFNITGLGNESLKRTFSVFNRLGDKDALEKVKKITISKDSTDNSRPGILKTTARPSSIGSTTVSLRQEPISLSNKTIGTMHADHEKNQKTTASVRQLVRTTKKIRLNAQPSAPKFSAKVTTKVSRPASKLASERVGIVPAKARLGLGGDGGNNVVTKQVTFDRFPKVNSFEKPGVFSRLGF